MEMETIPIRDYTGAMYDMFIDNPGIARAEAMGKTTVTGAHTAVYSLFNPASLHHVKDLEIPLGFMPSLSQVGNSFRLQYGGAIRCSKRWVSAFTFQKNYYNDEDFFFITGALLKSERPTDRRLNISTNYTILNQETHSLNVGFGFNGLFINRPQYYEYRTKSLDAGLSYTYKRNTHHLEFGLSTSNLFFKKAPDPNLDPEDFEYYNFHTLPQILRGGLSYSFLPEKKVTTKSLHLLEAMISLEMREVLNSNYFNSFNAGLELKWLEIISLRTGYYTNDHAFVGPHAAFLSTKPDAAITYGIGFNIPLAKRLEDRWPVTLRIDYTSLPHYNGTGYDYTDNDDYHKNFNVVNAQISWDLK
jgi:hypothetical protein